MQPTVENILTVFRNSTPEHYAQGKNWYPEANRLAASLDPINLVRSAGVIAAFSPRMPWWRNIECAKNLFDTGVATGSTKQFNAVAQSIFDGADPESVLGIKTRNFYRNILDPWDREPITIDAHAIDIALGRRNSTKERPTLTPKRYAEFSDAYRAAALMFNLAPATMQAITWVTWREATREDIAQWYTG